MGKIKSTMAALTTAAIVAAAVFKARSWNLTWGATPAELLAGLPGDDIVPVADLVATRAITIDAPASAVWPWLVQLGQDRGGFYSFDRLERLFKANIHNAETIHPEWQERAVGDAVMLVEGLGLELAVFEENRAFVLAGNPEFVSDSAPPFSFSWAFVLQPVPADGEGVAPGDGGASASADGGPSAPASTRLIVRERYGYEAGWVPLMVEPVSWVSLTMTAQMLRGIKQRAEKTARQTTS